MTCGRTFEIKRPPDTLDPITLLHAFQAAPDAHLTAGVETWDMHPIDWQDAVDSNGISRYPRYEVRLADRDGRLRAWLFTSSEMELAMGCDAMRPHRLIGVYHALRLQLFPVDWMVHFTHTGVLVAFGAQDAMRVMDTIRVDSGMNVVGIRHGDGLRVVIPSDVGVRDAACRLVDGLGLVSLGA